MIIQPGDLNHDGVIDEKDMSVYDEYKTAMNGIYREMASQLVLMRMTHTGYGDQTFRQGDALTRTDLEQVELLYKGEALDSSNFSQPEFYLGSEALLFDRDDLTAIDFNADGSFILTEAGTYYLYAVLRYTDKNLDPEQVDVVYQVAVLTVEEAPAVEPEQPEPELPDPTPEEPGDGSIDSGETEDVAPGDEGTGSDVTDDVDTNGETTGSGETEDVDPSDENTGSDVTDNADTDSETTGSDVTDSGNTGDQATDADDTDNAASSDELRAPAEDANQSADDAEQTTAGNQAPDISDMEPAAEKVTSVVHVTADLNRYTSRDSEPATETSSTADSGVDASDVSQDDEDAGNASDESPADSDISADGDSSDEAADDSHTSGPDDSATEPSDNSPADSDADSETESGSNSGASNSGNSSGSSGSASGRPSSGNSGSKPSKPVEAEKPARPEEPAEPDLDDQMAVTSEMDKLLMAVAGMDGDLDSDEVMDVLANAIGFDPRILDFDGNGYLNDGDLVHILVHWGMTADPGCYCNNPYSKYETYLQKYTGDN